MQWWMRPGPRRCWASEKPVALPPDQVGRRHPNVAVVDLGVVAEAPEALLGVLHGGHVAHDLEPRGVGRHQDHRRPLVGVDVGVGHRHHDQEVRHRPVAREPLVPVDDVLLPVALGAGAQQGGVRARRSRARSWRRRCASCRRAAAGATARAGRGVRSTRCRSPAARRCPSPGALFPKVTGPSERLAQDLVHQAEPDLAEPHPAQLGWEVGGPQPLLLHLVLEGTDDPEQLVIGQVRGSRAGRAPPARSRASTRASLRTPVRSQSPTPRRSPRVGPGRCGPSGPRTSRGRTQWPGEPPHA